MKDIRSLTGRIPIDQRHDIPYYRFYSVHDFQIANLLVQLVPNYNFTIIDYAANFRFELYRKGLSFFIKTIYNGDEIIFDNCKEHTMCNHFEWITYMKHRIWVDQAEKIKQKCNQEPTEENYKQMEPSNDPLLSLIIQ